MGLQQSHGSNVHRQDLHQRVLELRPLDAVLVHELVLDGYDNVQGVLPMFVEEVLRPLLWLHKHSSVWAHLRADRATRAVIWSELNRIVQTAELAALLPSSSCNPSVHFPSPSCQAGRAGQPHGGIQQSRDCTGCTCPGSTLALPQPEPASGTQTGQRGLATRAEATYRQAV